MFFRLEESRSIMFDILRRRLPPRDAFKSTADGVPIEISADGAVSVPSDRVLASDRTKADLEVIANIREERTKMAGADS